MAGVEETDIIPDGTFRCVNCGELCSGVPCEAGYCPACCDEECA